MLRAEHPLHRQRSRNIDSSRLPTRVAQRRSRYPVRLVRRISGWRSPLATPVSSVTPASIPACASSTSLAQEISIVCGDRRADPSRARPSCPRPSWCPFVSSVSHFLRREDDAVAVLSFTASPRLHQVWGHGRASRQFVGAAHLMRRDGRLCSPRRLIRGRAAAVTLAEAHGSTRTQPTMPIVVGAALGEGGVNHISMS